MKRYKVISEGMGLTFLSPRESYGYWFNIGDVIESDGVTVWHILADGRRHESITTANIVDVGLERGWIEEIIE
jgi:hypothetical protein